MKDKKEKRGHQDEEKREQRCERGAKKGGEGKTLWKALEGGRKWFWLRRTDIKEEEEQPRSKVSPKS